MGMKPGWADLRANGRIAFLEPKRKGRLMSPDQQRITAHVRTAGHLFIRH
jgi:hypothetical protein